MTVVADNTPTPSPADSNPGGAAAYGAATSTPASAGFTAASGVNVFQGLVTPTGNMPTSIPSKLETTNFTDVIPGSPAHTQGFGKGSKRPDITRLSDLVKLVSAVSQGQPLGGFDVDVLANVQKQAKLTPSEMQMVVNGQANARIGTSDLFAATPQETQAVTKAAWKDILTHVQSLGIAVPEDLQTPPNSANVTNKLKALGNVRVEHYTLDALGRNGYDTTGMKDVQSLISGHDAHQFATGAPGTTVTFPGSPQHNGQLSGAKLWDDFVTKWNTNPKSATDPVTGKALPNATDYRTAMLTDLVAVGAIDLTAGNPTDAQVATAYQGVMQQAAAAGQTVPETFNQLAGALPTGPGPNGAPVPITSENLDQAYVMHIADQILGPNSITPFQAQTLANLASKEGTSSSGAADLINEGIVSLADTNNPSSFTNGSSFANVAYQTVEDTLKQWGITLTPQQIAQQAKQVLTAGISTPYQVTTLAQTVAEDYAKKNIGNLYGPAVSALAQSGVNVATQAAPYLSTAATLLGTPASELDVTDPTGKWMKWSQGGTGPQGQMTQAEWAQYVMHDPSYNYDTSQTAKNESAAGAQGLLTLFGKLPSSAPNPFGSAGNLATQFGA